MRLRLVVVAAVALTDCSGSSNCGPTDPKVCSANRSLTSLVAGEWTQAPLANGTALQMRLSAHDTTLFGTGTYSTTGSPVGAVEISGFVFWRDSFFAPAGVEIPAEPVVVLDFAFDNGTTAHFDQATLTGQDTLTGVLTFSQDKFHSYGVSFIRAMTR